jgi:hypothetical protein
MVKKILCSRAGFVGQNPILRAKEGRMVAQAFQPMHKSPTVAAI